ncbi:hypothetical protein [Halioxenophilus aromaticivorans]|uniref:DUF4157 domain-containing protein n=1 Tax=Halioxenophilus aromaticivorans TaxID=1306992 RepID=A0AAV3TXM7_9ALTE
MIKRIETWIDSINAKYQPQRKPCSIFADEFSGFYSEQFLEDSYFVVIEETPKPNFPELRSVGLGDFIDMEVNGITYKNTYYVHPRCTGELRLHFHELVHVAQWKLLGAQHFITRYISEMQNYGYRDAPLEQMAYTLDGHYSQGGAPVDVANYVQSRL